MRPSEFSACFALTDDCEHLRQAHQMQGGESGSDDTAFRCNACPDCFRLIVKPGVSESGAGGHRFERHADVNEEGE